MCTRLLQQLALLPLVLLAAAPCAAASALERPDAALVVILLDGLVQQCIDERVDGERLMPRTAERAAKARRFSDVLSPSTNPAQARVALDEAVRAFGADEARTVRAADPATFEAALAALALRGGRQVLVVDLPWLEPPLSLDEATLLRLDPAPWTSMGTTLEIEAQVARRLARARQLAKLSGRGAGRGREPLLLDVQWVLRAAHAAIDARLDALLGRILEDATLGPRAAVVLTATSSTGSGARGPIGPYTGVELDVARVEVLLWAAGFAAGIDDRPRQWIGFDAAWFEAPGPEDRYTWSWGGEVAGQQPVCELRWTTPGFTLIDSPQPRRPPRLHDLELDRDEWFDRAVAEPALADSLRRELRARLYGATPVVVFEAGAEPVTLRLASRSRLAGPPGASASALRIEAGQRLRVRLLDGAHTLEFGRTLTVGIGPRQWELSSLVVHGPAWRAALAGPVEGSGLRLWLEQ